MSRVSLCTFTNRTSILWLRTTDTCYPTAYTGTGKPENRTISISQAETLEDSTFTRDDDLRRLIARKRSPEVSRPKSASSKGNPPRTSFGIPLCSTRTDRMRSVLSLLSPRPFTSYRRHLEANTSTKYEE
ncbi:hypothetical protein HN011_008424 [Eciton burchellii]|nr:hypothetical protein HN011_008424 [Eciton burchellii]